MGDDYRTGLEKDLTKIDMGRISVSTDWLEKLRDLPPVDYSGMPYPERELHSVSLLERENAILKVVVEILMLKAGESCFGLTEECLRDYRPHVIIIQRPDTREYEIRLPHVAARTKDMETEPIRPFRYEPFISPSKPKPVAAEATHNEDTCDDDVTLSLINVEVILDD